MPVSRIFSTKKSGRFWSTKGQIGIDEKLLTGNADHDLAIRQASGGCICCSSQLLLQIALARLTSEYRPDRLWIEPTGLVTPARAD